MKASRMGTGFLVSALVAGAMSVGVGCGSTMPPRELVDARAAYQRASTGPAAQVAMADLYTAQKALKRAEDSYSDDPKAQTTKDLAYIAQRKALFAEAQGETGLAAQQKAQATADLQQVEKQRMNGMAQQLQKTQQQLDDERRARAEAESRTKDAIDKLQGVAEMKKDQRGTVITLSGSVLFASGKSVLLPQAQKKLSELAQALKDDPNKNITVVGHTDSTGNEDKNMTLSKERADAVRNYLISQGLDESRLKSMGMGESQPVADNKSAEGRAENRRVELVLGNNERSASLDQNTMNQNRNSMPGGR